MRLEEYLVTILLMDSGWISVALSALGIIVVIILYYAARQKKSLSFEVLSEYPLISINDEVKGEIQVLYNGTPIENVHLLLIKFLNDGRIPITTTDFERPLRLQFKNSSDILSADPVAAEPENLKTSVQFNDKVVSIDPVLLNSGDFFTIKILVGKYSGAFNIDARLVGVRQIRKTRRQSVTTKQMFLLGLFMAGLVTTLIFTTTSVIKTKDSEPVIKTKDSEPEGVTLLGFKYFPPEIHANGIVVIMANASGEEFKWTAARGTFVGETNSYVVRYVAPLTPGQEIITLRVSSEIASVEAVDAFEVLPPEPPPNKK